MKTIKKNYSVLVALSFIAIVSSCKKESLENAPVNQPDPMQVQDSLFDPQDQVSMDRIPGCLLLSPEDYNRLPKLENENIPEVLPPSVFLQCPAIANQGSEGSCVAFGVAYSARSIMQRNLSGGTFALNTNCFSPEYVYNQIKVNSSCASGSYVTSAFQLLQVKGVTTWAQMPYSSTNGCSLQPTAKQNSAALLNKITGFTTISHTTLSIKNQLALNKPVIVAGPVDLNWQSLGYNQVYSSYNSAQFLGNHCYCVVGYDDTRNAFKVMNSWGTSWGTNGFGWISYNMAGTIFQEAYVINGLL